MVLSLLRQPCWPFRIIPLCMFFSVWPWPHPCLKEFLYPSFRKGNSPTNLFPFSSSSWLTNPGKRKVLVIQADFDDGIRSAQLVASAKYVFSACPETTWGTNTHAQPQKKLFPPSNVMNNTLTRIFSSFPQMTV